MSAARVLEELEQIERHLASLKDELKAELSGSPRPPAIYMTVPEYAIHRRVSRTTVNRWLRAGMPKSKRTGGTRICVADADAWNEDDATRAAATTAASKGTR